MRAHYYRHACGVYVTWRKEKECYFNGLQRGSVLLFQLPPLTWGRVTSQLPSIRYTVTHRNHLPSFQGELGREPVDDGSLVAILPLNLPASQGLVLGRQKDVLLCHTDELPFKAPAAAPSPRERWTIETILSSFQHIFLLISLLFCQQGTPLVTTKSSTFIYQGDTIDLPENREEPLNTSR